MRFDRFTKQNMTDCPDFCNERDNRIDDESIGKIAIYIEMLSGHHSAILPNISTLSWNIYLAGNALKERKYLVCTRIIVAPTDELNAPGFVLKNQTHTSLLLLTSIAKTRHSDPNVPNTFPYNPKIFWLKGKEKQKAQYH